MHAMMQTRIQKVEKFFVFFSTKLGLLHPASSSCRSGALKGGDLRPAYGAIKRSLMLEFGFGCRLLRQWRWHHLQ